MSNFVTPPLPFTAGIVAENILLVLDAAVAARGRATLAIPGGRSPGPILTALAGMMTDFVRERLHLLWLDERAVPPGHGDRNDDAMLAAWSAGGALPAFVHRMPAEDDDLQGAAEAYAATIAEITDGDAIDLCLIGIGEDGHFASLFPNHPLLKDLDQVCAIEDSPKPPLRRLTMSLPLVSRCQHCHILVLGESKGLVFKAIRDRGQTADYPISLLPAGHCVWYLDPPAGEALA